MSNLPLIIQKCHILSDIWISADVRFNSLELSDIMTSPINLMTSHLWSQLGLADPTRGWLVPVVHEWWKWLKGWYDLFVFTHYVSDKKQDFREKSEIWSSDLPHPTEYDAFSAHYLFYESNLATLKRFQIWNKLLGVTWNNTDCLWIQMKTCMFEMVFHPLIVCILLFCPLSVIVLVLFFPLSIVSVCCGKVM